MVLNIWLSLIKCSDTLNTLHDDINFKTISFRATVR